MLAGSQDLMLALDGISIGYRRETPLLQKVCLTAERGEMVALVGRNGAGKSTLLRSLLGLIPLLEGNCLVRNIPLHHYGMKERARTLSYVSSQSARLPSITVRELVTLGRLPYTSWTGRPGPEDRERVEWAISEVGMSEHADSKLDQISDGERQRIMIARALVQDTPVMVLDEPAAFLDIANKYELVRILSSFRDQGKTVLYSTHDLEMAMMCADKLWVIAGGIMHEGSPEEIGLSGLFDRLFESSSIRFDTESGRFIYAGSERGNIGLSSPAGPVSLWTQRALERIGFRVTAGEHETEVEVVYLGQGYLWRIKRGGSRSEFSTLYQMARFLTRER